MSEKKGPMLDPNLTLVQLLDDALYVFLHTLPQKPADPEVWVRLGRIDQVRRQLQRDLGMEPSQMTDPQGRVSYEK